MFQKQGLILSFGLKEIHIQRDLNPCDAVKT